MFTPSGRPCRRTLGSTGHTIRWANNAGSNNECARHSWAACSPRPCWWPWSAGPPPPAPIRRSGGEGSASASRSRVGGEEVVPPDARRDRHRSALPGDGLRAVVDVPADPLAVNGTLDRVRSTSTRTSDLVTFLETSAQAVAGPYNARAVGVVEDAEVLVDAVDSEAQVSLFEVDVHPWRGRGQVRRATRSPTRPTPRREPGRRRRDRVSATPSTTCSTPLFPGLDPARPGRELRGERRHRPARRRPRRRRPRGHRARGR